MGAVWDAALSRAAAPSPGDAPIEDLMMTLVNSRAVLERAKRASDLAESALADAITQRTTNVAQSTVAASGIPVDLLTFGHSPLLNDLDETQSSVPLVVQMPFIDSVFKSTKISKRGQETARASKRREKLAKDTKTAKELMPPPPPRRPRKRRSSMLTAVPEETTHDPVALDLLCREDRSALWDW